MPTRRGRGFAHASVPPDFVRHGRASTAPTLPLPLQGERVGGGGPIRTLGVRGEAPSSRPSPPEGGEGAQAFCQKSHAIALRTSPGMTRRDYNLISPRLMLCPSVAATVLAGRPEAAISTV